MKKFIGRTTLVMGFPLIFVVTITAMTIIDIYFSAQKLLKLFKAAWDVA